MVLSQSLGYLWRQYERSRVKVKVEPRSTFTFSCYPLHIFYFIYVSKNYENRNPPLERTMHEKVGINAKQCYTCTLLTRDHPSDSMREKSCQGVATLVPV